ncbi:MAG: hypothetical protein WDN28_04845 [Chthoniobacter sp.]
MPYDRFVAELVNPTKASEGFSRGIIWRGQRECLDAPADAGGAKRLAGPSSA